SISIAANQGNTRAKVFVASSAAALVSDRAYRECTAPPSIGVLREIAKILQDSDFITISNLRYKCRPKLAFRSGSAAYHNRSA
ncbi:hypothetical protein, partial [Rhizobium lusitanum]|uniref:hypothetical protein n=1 Tax=Rhizobium lusitanum TaxID=293958 RepID=UPI001AEE487C